jgi:membrane protease YdiL (CAAX protease family)
MNLEIAFDLENAAGAVPSPAPASALEPPADKPRVWTVFATWFAAALIGQIAVIATFIMAGIALGILLGVQGVDPAEISPKIQAMLMQPLPALLLSLLPFQFTLLLVVVLAARKSPEPVRERLGLLSPAGRKFGGLSLAGLAACTLSLALVILIGSILAFGQPASNATEATVSQGSWLSITLLAVVLSLVPAVIEEIVFRGYIQRRFLQRWSPTAAVAVSTLLFALLHCDSLQHILSVIPLGIVTGWLAHRTNSAKPGMVVHAIHNAGAVAFAAVAKVLIPALGNEGAGWVILGGIALLAAVSVPAVIALFRGEQSPAATPTPSLSQSALAV